LPPELSQLEKAPGSPRLEPAMEEVGKLRLQPSPSNSKVERMKVPREPPPSTVALIVPEMAAPKVATPIAK
jgi:hypothetical protein